MSMKKNQKIHKDLASIEECIFTSSWKCYYRNQRSYGFQVFDNINAFFNNKEPIDRVV